MKLNRKWILVMSLVLSVAIATSGTLAYLMDTTETKRNTFTIGNVDITLSEPTWVDKGHENNSPKLVPGVAIEKDPTITLAAGSENAWVWLEVAMTENMYKVLGLGELNNGWMTGPEKTVTDENTGAVSKVITLLYNNELSAGNAVTAFDEVIPYADVDNAALEALENDDELYVDVTAYAIQDSFASVYEAYAAANNLPYVKATDKTAAQSALDNAASGTIIELAPNTDYGTLLVRPVVGAAHTEAGNWHAGGWSHELARTIENVTILGDDGAKVDAIKFDTGFKGDTYGTEVNDLYTYVTIKNLVIDGVEFTNNAPATGYSYTSSIFVDLYNTNLDGLTVKNCTVSGAADNNFVYIVDEGEASTFTTAAKNVTITGNTVNNVGRLAELRGTENVTITGNVVNGTKYHGVLLAGSGYSGNIVISNNTFNSVGSDGDVNVVRMAGADAANVTISNNTATNYLGGRADFAKVDGGTPVIENNTFIN